MTLSLKKFSQYNAVHTLYLYLYVFIHCICMCLYIVFVCVYTLYLYVFVHCICTLYLYVFIHCICMCLYIIFTYGSSALLGCPCCGLSTWLLLLATIHFSKFMPICFMRKQTKHKNTRSAIFEWHENSCQQLLGAQSINIERASLTGF